MALIVHTRDIGDDHPLIADPNTRLWVYNGLDCVVTRHVHDALAPMVAEPGHAIPYRFVRACQGPALDMMLRGIAVNAADKRRAMDAARRAIDEARALLDELATAVWGRGLNPDSSLQMKAFFYTALAMPPQYNLVKTPEGKRRVLTCDHAALETFAKLDTKGPGIDPRDRAEIKVRYAAPFVSLITGIREKAKRYNKLASYGDRFHFGVNVVGTVTGRQSTSSDAFGRGDNAQNINDIDRRPLCADDGWKVLVGDKEQAESRYVAAMTWAATGDDGYWKACESGDLHTTVCTMVWRTEFAEYGAWDANRGVFEGDLRAARVKAETKWYRHLTYRDGAKRKGHGTNYWGSAFGIAMQIGDVEPRVVTDFQHRYFGAFPGIRGWHTSTITYLQTHMYLWNILGMRRYFFKRVKEDSTIREAIAHLGQSANGQVLLVMLYRVWRYGIDGGPNGSPGTLTLPNGQVVPWRSVVQLLLQVHDSVVLQYRDRPDIEAAVIDKVRELMDVPIPITRASTGETRTLRIPIEFKVGWNLGPADPKKEKWPDGNPDGLDKWRGPNSDTRKRQRGARASAADWLA